MELEVYEGRVKNKTYLALEKTGEIIKLIAVNPDGTDVINGSILSISEKGLHLYSGITDKLEIAMDNNGVIKEIKG